MAKHKWPEDYTRCYDQRELDAAVSSERARCAEIVRQHQISFASDACGWALDKILDGLPADAVR